MTLIEMKNLGFKLWEHRGKNGTLYTHPLFFQYCVHIPHDATIEYIMNMIYERGLKVGRDNGRAEIQRELKTLLNIQTEESNG